MIALKAPDLKGIKRAPAQIQKLATYLLPGCEVAVPVVGRPAIRTAGIVSSSRRGEIGGCCVPEIR